MADGYDTIHEAHLLDTEWTSYEDNYVLFRCRKGGDLRPRLTLSGAVEHRCLKCQHTIVQSREDHRAMLARMQAHGDHYEVDCPMVVMYKGRRRGRLR